MYFFALKCDNVGLFAVYRFMDGIMSKIKTIVIFLIVFAHVIAVKGQCDMSIVYTVIGNLPNAYGTLRLICPDGKSITLYDGADRQINGSYHLEQLGNYRLKVVFSSAISGRESLERSFSLTGEEYKVEVSARFEREKKDIFDTKSKDSITSGLFKITKYSNPSPLVKIRYLRNSKGENREFPGPHFLVQNESRDTLYGEWLPGYFWGTLSRWEDGEYVGNYGGQICTTWKDEPPLYPNAKTMAWVASFGRRTSPGKYRFNLYYSTKEGAKGSARKVSETDSFVWWSAVQNWHLLTCEFEVKAD